jgi:peptide chain release factor 1
MIARAKLDRIRARHAELEAQLAAGGAGGEAFAKLSREYSELGPVVAAIDDFMRLADEKADLEGLLAEPDGDGEMRKLAADELATLKDKLPGAEKALAIMLLPKDAADAMNAIVEVRAGTGGDEAGLFAGELFELYRRYAELRGWKFEVMSYGETDLGGVKEASAEISGSGVFARLKFESGVHRVQRVPATEASGRIHTSAATVAVLPEAEDVDIKVEDKDLRIDVYRASGAGGQHVNKTESAVRITHLPTGIVVAMQEEKSQHKNKAKAMKMLRAKIYEGERERLARERAATRKDQVGSGDRSEKIRTYNFPQDRVTDHRVGMTLHQLDAFMKGEGLDKIVDALIADEQAAKLAEVSDE